MAAAVEAAEIRMMGRTTGRIESRKGGGSLSGRSMAAVSLWLPGTATSSFALIRLMRNQDAVSGIAPTSRAAMMLWPTSTVRIFDMARGPGWGATSAWVITPPEQMAMMYMT